ncbi:hypothetical protein BCV70DRAFT_140150, partial [Testicularia cyperi]
DGGAVVRVTDPDARRILTEGEDEQSQRQPPSSSLPLLSELAPEVLTRIFAFLDPVSLCRSAAVCRSWAFVARDDATWRAAFATYFSLEAAQANRQVALESSTTPALRRLVGNSWRQEFQQRVDSLRRWRKSRTPTVLSTPRVDIIRKISLSKQHRLLISASDAYGVASRSNPWTGKVTKGYLDAEGTANGAGNGNPNVEFSPNVTTLNTSADASNIFWGFRSGEVGMTSMSRQGMNPRGLIRSHRFSPRACHAGPVSAIAIPFASDSDGAHGPGRSPERLRQAMAGMGDVATTFVSAGYDGTVRMWSSSRAWPLWIASTSPSAPVSNAIASTSGGAAAQSNTEAASPICALAYDAKHGVVAAGTTSGKLFVWHNIDVAALLQVSPEATDPDHLRQGSLAPEIVEGQSRFAQISGQIRTTAIDLPPGTGAPTAVDSLFIDATSPADTSARSETDLSLLVHHSGASVLLRHRIASDVNAPVETTVLGAAVMDEITAVRPDFEPRLPKRDDRSSTAQSTSASVYASPVLSATGAQPGFKPGAGSALTPNIEIPRLVLGPSPFQTYSGQGRYPERKFVCTGTRSGSLFLFDWEAEGTAFDETAQEEWQGHRPARFTGSRQLLPSIGWEAHHTSITALEMTPLSLFVGTSDGTIKVFDALAGDLVRTINDRTATKHPARMLAAGELTGTEAARFRVTQIIADNDCLVASIGHQVLAFRAEPVLSGREKRAAAAAAANAGSARNKGRPRATESKYALQMEMERDLRESRAELAAENKERQAEYEKIRGRQDFELEGLSEAEAMEYALMLSRDEEAAQATRKAQYMGGRGYVPGSHASSSRKRIEVAEQPIDDPELADALEQIALAESKAEAERYMAGEAPAPFYSRSRSNNIAGTAARSKASGTSAKGKTYRMLDDHDFGTTDDFDVEDLDDYSNGNPSDRDAAESDLDSYLRPSPSPSPQTSPYLTGIGSPASRAWTILSQAGAAATTPARSADRWGQHSKVRTVAVPRSARMSSRSSHVGSPAGAGEPASFSSSFGSLDPLSPPVLASPTDFPAMPTSVSPHATGGSP